MTPARTAQSALRLYKKVAPAFLPPACRFYPSCADYARQAIGCYGLMRGLLKTARRLARCQPWHPGGYDPVK